MNINRALRRVLWALTLSGALASSSRSTLTSLKAELAAARDFTHFEALLRLQLERGSWSAANEAGVDAATSSSSSRPTPNLAGVHAANEEALLQVQQEQLADADRSRSPRRATYQEAGDRVMGPLPDASALRNSDTTALAGPLPVPTSVQLPSPATEAAIARARESLQRQINEYVAKRQESEQDLQRVRLLRQQGTIGSHVSAATLDDQIRTLERGVSVCDMVVQEFRARLEGPADALTTTHQFGDPENNVVVVMGNMGQGKSTFLNLLNGNPRPDLFVARGGADGVTNTTEARTIHWLGDAAAPNVVVVDTPGLGSGSSGGQSDSDHIRNMVDEIQKLDFYYRGVSRFLIVMNGTCPRFDAGIQDMIREFRRTFARTDADPATTLKRPVEEWLNHVSFVFTHWDHSEAAHEMRIEQDDLSADEVPYGSGYYQEKRRVEASRKVGEILGVECDIPAIFIDSWHVRYRFPDQSAREEYARQIGILREQVVNAQSKFPCQNIVAAQCKYDEMKTQLAEEARMRAEAERAVQVANAQAQAAQRQAAETRRQLARAQEERRVAQEQAAAAQRAADLRALRLPPITAPQGSDEGYAFKLVWGPGGRPRGTRNW